MLPYKRYKKSASILENVKLAAVSARASRWSQMWPARMPLKSNSVDRIPAVESAKYSPPIAGRKKKDGKQSVNVCNKTESGY